MSVDYFASGTCAAVLSDWRETEPSLTADPFLCRAMKLPTYRFYHLCTFRILTRHLLIWCFTLSPFLRPPSHPQHCPLKVPLLVIPVGFLEINGTAGGYGTSLDGWSSCWACSRVKRGFWHVWSSMGRLKLEMGPITFLC